MGNILLIEQSELKKIVKTAILEVEEERKVKLANEKLYTINEVAKRLGKAHNTIKKLVHAGYIKTTASGLITEASINDYLYKI